MFIELPVFEIALKDENQQQYFIDPLAMLHFSAKKYRCLLLCAAGSSMLS